MTVADPVLPMSAPVRTRGPALAGGAVILLTFGTLAVWSALAPLSSAVVATGTIVVDGSRKAVQHLDGGVISAIHVRDGDQVEAGQDLIELDDFQARRVCSQPCNRCWR